MRNKFAEVAVPLPLRSTFHYRVPRKLESQAVPGTRVRVPFGFRHLTGILVALADRTEVPRVKPLEEVLDEQPLFQPEMLELTRWIAQVYQAGWGETLGAALPGPLRRKNRKMRPFKEEPRPPAPPHPPPQLNAEQQAALRAIIPAVRASAHTVFLLHGVTGSGKTEVYLQAIEEALSRKRTSIVLVPEISLTPQTIERFEGRFGREAVAVLHSHLTEAKRLHEWQRIRGGQARVVVGARSAVFAPIQALGLIVVDEEHEPSYKQEDAPRYHAREVAIRRAELAGAPVILGSATPSLESYWRATGGPPDAGTPGRRYELLRLTERIEQIPLPKVEIVDMRRELASGRRSRIFSHALEESLAETLKSKQQAMLFLNRRGFATFVHCRKCGFTLRCSSCQITMTYHIATKQMLCHSCRATLPPPDLCPQCRSDYIRFQGIGTQKVESELGRLLPEARIARMDTDATAPRGSHAAILTAFRDHQVDVLVGTQMIAKGLDFPRVTLVGVISADTALNLPDFRAAERTFNLLTQVAGRAGRGRAPGKVIVQTYAPHHYAILAAREHDYLSFYRQEIAIRRQLFLPPFSRLIRMTLRSPRESRAAEGAKTLAALCRKVLRPPVQVTGPAPAVIPRLRRQYRWGLELRAPTLDPVQAELPQILSQFHPPHGSHLAVDVDPL